MSGAVVEIFTPADIHRYVDGELSFDEREALRELLEEDPDRMAELMAYERQNVLLVRKFGPKRA
jgi:anti-sigma factor RsiW